MHDDEFDEGANVLINESFTQKKKMYLRNYLFAWISFGEEECTTIVDAMPGSSLRHGSRFIYFFFLGLMSRDLYIPSTLAVTWHLDSKISRQCKRWSCWPKRPKRPWQLLTLIWWQWFRHNVKDWSDPSICIRISAVWFDGRGHSRH